MIFDSHRRAMGKDASFSVRIRYVWYPIHLAPKLEKTCWGMNLIQRRGRTRNVQWQVENLLHPLRTWMMPYLKACPWAFLFHKPISFLFFTCLSLSFLHVYFYWSIADLQCFRSTARWFRYTRARVLFLKLFSIIGYYKILTTVPCAT